jgi:putative ABC transport system substrate-binding protein
MNRRDMFALLGGAAMLPVAARAQQAGMPVIGFLRSSSSLANAKSLVMAFGLGLKEAGYVEGQNVAFEFRSAENYPDRLPALAADLVRRKVAVIVATNTQTALTAKAATQTIPIVFQGGADPVEIGLVASLNRPGSNLTGMSILNSTIAAKRLQLLYELVPVATSIAFLVNPANPVLAESETKQVRPAALALGVNLQLLNASDHDGIEAAFATLLRQQVGALQVSADPLFITQTDQLVGLSAQYAVPTMYQYRDFTAAGGLMSYGASLTDQYRQLGVYAGRILKGERPADLPILQPTKFEFVINLKTAKALDLTVSPTLLAIADEVIE